MYNVIHPIVYWVLRGVLKFLRLVGSEKLDIDKAGQKGGALCGESTTPCFIVTARQLWLLALLVIALLVGRKSSG